MSSNKEIIVRCEGLTKRYDELTALDNLNLEIPASHVFGYVGHNGAGKTTTIRILAGLLKATSGQATISGVSVDSGRDKIKSLVGYMPDSFGVYDQMRVWEYLDFFGAAFKLPRKQRRQRIEEVMDITESQYMRDRFVDTLSKGMKQRVGIARTLMHDPQVLLLDEPANGLDPRARVMMRHLLRKLAERGKTLIVSSHILPELAAMCDSIGIIYQGKLRTAGPLHKVLAEMRRDRAMEAKVLGQPQVVLELLAAEPTCAEPAQDEIDSGVVHFRFNGDDEALAGLLDRIRQSGVRIVTFREVPLSLEDAYMAISDIGEQAQPASAAE